MSALDIIRETIKQQGAITFANFMQLALYEPQYGYYQTLSNIGLQGDFTTAPEMTSLFAYCVANQCVDIFKVLQHPYLLEFGAGTGKLCVDILTHCEEKNSLPSQYFILELSASLKTVQQQYIHEQIPHLFDRVHWLSHWPNDSFEGVMIGNEVLDAMPVHRFLQTDKQLFEYYVDLNDNQELIETIKPCTDQRLLQHIKLTLPVQSGPYQSEANLFIDDWLKQCHNRLKKGVVMLFDYGFPRHELYHPDRSQGTLMCHKSHRAHTNPLIDVGKQDITAHVDFTHVAEAADSAGFQVAGFTSQASFLLGNGILDELINLPQAEQFMVQQVVKKLLSPNEMGELFKVIALSKGIDMPLKGFKFQDRRASL